MRGLLKLSASIDRVAFTNRSAQDRMEASKGLDEFKVAHKTIAVIKTMDAFLDCQNVMMSMMDWNEVDTWVSNHVYSAQDCPVKLAAMVRGAPHIDNPGHRFRIRVCVWPIIRVMHGEPTRAVTAPWPSRSAVHPATSKAGSG